VSLCIRSSEQTHEAEFDAILVGVVGVKPLILQIHPAMSTGSLSAFFIH